MSQNEVRDSSVVESNSDISNGSKEHISHLKFPSYGKNSNAAGKIGPGFQHDTSPRSSTSSKDQGIVLTADTEQFIIGQRVWVSGTSPGQIAYIGETHFAPGEWAGVVLDEANGKNDGCVAGKRYFQCEPKKGIFSRLTRLTVQPLEVVAAKGLSKLSPDRSCTVSPTPSTRSTLNKSTGRHGLQLGDRVIVSSGFGSRPGTLRFIGETKFASGNWCGIELDEATGKNDGSVDGVRYFECIAKYGIFVPIAKVSLSPSSKKSRLSRAGSRESLTSVGTMNSIATTNTSRLRMQRKSSLIKPVNATKSSFSMQDLIREKQNHIEQLMIERDLDQEDAQNQALHFQKIISELKSKIVSLEIKLEEEKSKTEELQFSIEEATFCGDELNAQTQVYKEKISDLEQRLQAVTLGAGNYHNLDLINLPVQIKVSEQANENALLSIQPSGDDDIVTKSFHSDSTSANVSDIIHETDFSSVLESKNNIHKISQHPFNRYENCKLEEATAHESLITFRNLICKIKEFENQEHDLQEQLNHYFGNPEQIRLVHSMNKPPLQTDTLLINDLCESLAMTINELNLMRFDIENTRSKCKNLENALQTNKEETNQLEVERFDISRKLEDVTSNCQSLSELNGKLQQEIKTNEERTKLLDVEKFEISQKLVDVTSNCESLSEFNDKLCQELKTNQEKTERLEVEKLDISRQLEDVTSNSKSLSELNDKLQQEIKANEEKLELLGVEKFDISQKLEEVTSNCKSLSELSDKLQQKIKTDEEKTKLLEVEKSNVSRRLEDLTSNWESLSEVNGKLQQELKTNEEKARLLEVEKFDISRKLEELTSNCESLSELNDKLKQELKTNEEKTKLLEVEKLNISGILEKVTSNSGGLSEVNDKLQQELKTNEEKAKRLEVEKFDISRKFEDIALNFESLSDQNNKLQQELKTNEEKTKLLEVKMFDVSRELGDVTSNCDSLSKLNEKLQQELKTNEEKTKGLEVERFDISRKLEDVTLSNKSLSELNAGLQQTLRTNEEKISQLEVLNFDISRKLETITSDYERLSELNNKQQEELMSQKLEDATSNCGSLLELNNKLQLELKNVEEKTTRLEVEKFDISLKLEDVTSNCKSLSELTDKLQKELKSNEETTKRLEVEKFDMSRQLEDVKSNYESLLELNAKQQQELKTNEEKTNRLEGEKFDISRQLVDVTSNCTSLSELRDQLQQKLRTNEEKTSHLEVNNFDISRQLEDVKSNCKSLSELNDKLQQELKTNAENIYKLEVDKSDISRKLEGVTSECKSLSELYDKLQEKLQTYEDKTNQLEVEKSDISRKLENVISNCETLSDLNEKLKQELQASEEKTNQIQVNNGDICEKLEDVTLNCKNLAELNEKLQQELKANKEQINRLEEENSDVVRKLENITFDYRNLSELNEKLQQELKSNEEKINLLAEKNFEIIQKLEDITSKYEILSEKNNKLQQELVSRNFSSNSETLNNCMDPLAQKESIGKELKSTCNASIDQTIEVTEKITENQKVNENTHNEYNSGRIHLGNQLQEVNQILNVITIEMESLDQDIRSISPDSKIRAELLSAAEEKSCKLQFDCSDLTRRFEALKENYKKINSKRYSSVKELISAGISEEVKENVKKQDNSSDEKTLLRINSNTLNNPNIKLCEQIRFLQDKVANFKTAFMLKEEELAKELANISLKKKSLSTPEELVEIDPVLNSLQIDLETTRNFIDKIEELNIFLKSVSYSYFKLIKNNAQLSEALELLKKEKLPDSSNLKPNDLDMAKLAEQFEIANKKLQDECLELTKFLAYSMESFDDNCKECYDKPITTLNKSILPKSSIEGFIERINEIIDSNSLLSNKLAEKIKLLQKTRVSLQSDCFSNESCQLSAQLAESSKNVENPEKVDLLTKQNISGNNTIVQKKVEAEELKLNNASQSTKKLEADGTWNTEDKTAHINFLNSIIADMQQKNDTLKNKIIALEAFSTDFQKSYMFNMFADRKPAPRMFCDICDQFDLHETEDCPVQESDGGEPTLLSLEVKSNNNNVRVLPEPRKYCANCEAFGNHTAEDCYAGLE